MILKFQEILFILTLVQGFFTFSLEQLSNYDRHRKLHCFNFYLYLKSGTSFDWIDGSINNYQAWALGEPNGIDREGQECAELFPIGGFAGHWNDHSCEGARHFACKMPKCRSFKSILV